MTKKDAIKIFEDKKIRTVWDDKTEEWYFSVIDVIEALTDTTNPRRYWSDLKIKLSKEGSQLYDSIVQLKMPAPDGKMRKPMLPLQNSFSSHPICSLSQSGAVQTLDSTSCQRTIRRDAGPGAND